MLQFRLVLRSHISFRVIKRTLQMIHVYSYSVLIRINIVQKNNINLITSIYWHSQSPEKTWRGGYLEALALSFYTHHPFLIYPPSTPCSHTQKFNAFPYTNIVPSSHTQTFYHLPIHKYFTIFPYTHILLPSHTQKVYRFPIHKHFNVHYFFVFLFKIVTIPHHYDIKLHKIHPNSPYNISWNTPWKRKCLLPKSKGMKCHIRENRKSREY